MKYLQCTTEKPVRCIILPELIFYCRFTLELFFEFGDCFYSYSESLCPCHLHLRLCIYKKKWKKIQKKNLHFHFRLSFSVKSWFWWWRWWYIPRQEASEERYSAQASYEYYALVAVSTLGGKNWPLLCCSLTLKWRYLERASILCKSKLCFPVRLFHFMLGSA